MSGWRCLWDTVNPKTSLTESERTNKTTTKIRDSKTIDFPAMFFNLNTTFYYLYSIQPIVSAEPKQTDKRRPQHDFPIHFV